MNIKGIIRSVLKAAGYEVYRISRNPGRISRDLGRDPFLDMRKLSERGRRLVVFDVGANVGQSVTRFRSTFDNPIIHAFEPGRDAFFELRHRTANIPDLHLNNVALGSQSGVTEFLEIRIQT